MKDKIIKMYTENSIDMESFVTLMEEYLNSEYIKRILETRKSSPQVIMNEYFSYPENVRLGMTNMIIGVIAPYINAKYGITFLKDKDGNVIKIF